MVERSQAADSAVACSPRALASMDPRGPAEPILGSYFVSAYPPFACWTEAAARAFERRLDRPPATPDGFGLYVHIPFCSERCRFCYYLSHDDRPGDLDAYLDALLSELRLYGGRPFLENRELDFVYFGGGTPSLLSAKQIGKLLGSLQRIFPWSEAREVTFECAPRSVTTAKLGALRELGVTRISLGVQEFDDEVLERNGRVHRVADVERAVMRIRGVGFPVLNLDLISGLVGQTETTFRASVERLIEVAPESVTIYLLEVPHNTPLFRTILRGDPEAEPPPWAAKRAWLEAGFERLEGSGYELRSAYTAVRDRERHAFVYQDEQYRGADLLGIGASSFSYLGGVHHQNLANLGQYLEVASRGRLPLWRGYALDAEERFVRELVLQLKLGTVERGYFLNKFGRDPLEVYRRPIERLRAQGWLDVEDGFLRLTVAGLARVDRLVRQFYRPEHRPAVGRRP